VVNALGWICGTSRGKSASPSSSAYCQGRKRLPEEKLKDVFAHVTDSIESQSNESRRWMGRTVKIIDGSTVTMADTPENQKEYPQHSSQRKGCGFPIMRLLAVFSLATGAILHMESACFSIGEQVLFRRIRNLLSSADVILADRGFCSYADICLLLEASIDMVVRMKTKLIKKLCCSEKVRCQRFSDIMGKACISSGKNRQEDMGRTPRKSCPENGHIRGRSQGFRSRSITILTTLTDHRAFPKKIVH